MLETLTELDAVNRILSAIGSDPVTTLEDDMDIDIINARSILAAVSRDIQRKGWDFNRTTRTLTPTLGEKKIPWDTTTLTLKANDGNTYVKRGDWLYNMTQGTYEFSHPIDVEITCGVDFEDLPDPFKNYVIAKASIDFAMRYFGDASVAQDLQAALQMAHQDIVQYDMEMGSCNMLQIGETPSILERT